MISLPDELHDRLRQALSGELELPLLSTTALEVLSACADEDCAATDLTSILAHDPSLSGNVMRVVNSAAFAPTEPVASLQRAIASLGIRAVRNIAVAISVHGRVFRGPGYLPELRRIWQHAALAGVWAQELARTQRKNVEVAFLVGLLHDVGRPVVLEALTSIEETRDLDYAQLSPLLDEFHAEIGARVLAGWGLPESVALPVACHHDPAAAGPHQPAALLTYFADRLAQADHGRPAEQALGELADDPWLDELGLYFDDLLELWEQRDSFQWRAGDLQ